LPKQPPYEPGLVLLVLGDVGIRVDHGVTGVVAGVTFQATGKAVEGQRLKMGVAEEDGGVVLVVLVHEDVLHGCLMCKAFGMRSPTHA
jgi:hypothetical protein